MADGQRRGHWGGLQTYLPNCCTSCHSTLSLFVSMVVHATSPKPFPSPLARVVVAPLQMRNFNVKTPSSLWTFHHAVPSPSFSTWELSVTENQCQSVCGQPMHVWQHRNEASNDILWGNNRGVTESFPGTKTTSWLHMLGHLKPSKSPTIQ